IKASNSGNYDFHLALHSNAAPKGEEGTRQGVEVYYFPYSPSGEKMAEVIAENYQHIYPNPELIKILPTTSLGEVDRTKAPSVLLETAYHDNSYDANWILENIDAIARSLALSLTEYFNIPFQEPMPPAEGTVVTQWGSLNLRNLPNIHSEILATLPRGADVIVFGMDGNWAKVLYNGILGFADKNYIRII
ncbi:MAG: N-acetylmuramoyl-L-alanine amidase, partial [Oscillospiraceae bacterium]